MCNDVLLRTEQAQAIICLKNDQKQLPIDQAAVKTVAVIGPHATTGYELLGAYANSDNKAVANHTMLLAARRRFGEKVVTHASGCSDLYCQNTSGFSAAVAAAKAADVAVVFVGISGQFEGEGHDRNKPGSSGSGLALPGNQSALALACIAANPKTIVVLIHGGMVLIDEIVATGAAVVTALYPGQEGGDAVWDVLTGDRPAAGKLVYTWYRKTFETERGPINDQNLRAGLGITYRYYKGDPLFKYGHGLSFTALEYSWNHAPPATMRTSEAAGGFSLSVAVSNTGTIASDCVVLVFGSLVGTDCPLVSYLHPILTQSSPNPHLILSQRTLVGFGRVSLVQPGSKVNLEITIDPRTLGCVDDAGEHFLHFIPKFPSIYTFKNGGLI